ncbi:MAG: LamG-like jellyroll fold domain-containing protein [Pirellula sp.]
MRLQRLSLGLVAVTTLTAVGSSFAQAQDSLADLRKALSFHSSFDSGVDADFARGDRALWNAPKINQRETATLGLPVGGEVQLEQGSGKFGGAVHFSKSKGPMVFYKADKNVPMPNRDWSATLSFWLRTDPAGDLQEGFCDPVQLTSKQWDDAAIFVEFEKRATGIPFRLGVYADKSVWNPTGRKFETIPADERPLVTVPAPPFAGNKWTHVVVVLSKFNSGSADGLSTLYLDGKKAGEISARQQTFTWTTDRAALMLGLSYIGYMDDVAMFDRALTSQEVEQVYGLKKGVTELVQR